MNMKKTICSALAAAAAFSSVSAAASNRTDFSDVSESHWAYEHINSMSERKIIEGYDDGTFLPEKAVTRAEFAKMLAGAASLAQDDAVFSDVSEDAWYADYVSAVSQYLVPVGNLFMPTSEAKRKDIAAAIARVKSYDTAAADTTAVESRFSDVSTLSVEEKLYIAAAVENGIMDGFDEGVFKPNDGITRAQAAAILYRAFGNDDLTAIKVNNISVNINDIDRMAKEYMSDYDFLSDEEKSYVKQMLTQSIQETLIYGEIGKEMGMELTEEQRRNIESYISQSSYPNAPSTAFLNTLYNAAEYQDIIMNMYAEELTNAENADALIDEYYRSNYFCAKHILVEDETLADDLLKKVQSGEDFDSLMREYSTDPGTEYSPDGYVFTYGEMVEEFENCVKNTDIGDFGLCKSDYGWHVILRLELPGDYSDMQDDIKSSYVYSHITRRMNEDALKYGITSEINRELVNAVG